MFSRSNSKGKVAARIRLLWILVWIPTVAAFGQQAAKDLANPDANVQNAISYNDRGIAKQRKGDLGGALADYDQAIKLNPKNAFAYNNRGTAKEKKGDLDGALADYNQAIQLDPKYAAAYKDRGNAKRKKGDLQGARADFSQAVKLGSKSGDVAESPD